MLILIAGPYRSGTNDNPALMQENLNKLESVAHRLPEKCEAVLHLEGVSKGADDDVRIATEKG
ncbi:MAG TPA: hypothetical protein VFI29_15405 [Hanamia sp.]|nr:hypothetical protein [Hanamia sp.]